VQCALSEFHRYAWLEHKPSIRTKNNDFFSFYIIVDFLEYVDFFHARRTKERRKRTDAITAPAHCCSLPTHPAWCTVTITNYEEQREESEAAPAPARTCSQHLAGTIIDRFILLIVWRKSERTTHLIHVDARSVLKDSISVRRPVPSV
jgi:hypothetical protein